MKSIKYKGSVYVQAEGNLKMKSIKYKGSVYVQAEGNPTAVEIASSIFDALPEFHHAVFNSYWKKGLVGEDSVFISFASVPKGSGELKALNSKMQFMIDIDAGRSWIRDQPAPDKIRAEQFRSSGVEKMRARSGPPDKIVKYVIDYMKKHAKVFLEEVKKSSQPESDE
jgi:hypothetical protein